MNFTIKRAVSVLAGGLYYLLCDSQNSAFIYKCDETMDSPTYDTYSYTIKYSIAVIRILVNMATI